MSEVDMKEVLSKYIAENPHYITLDSGIQQAYIEFGEENEEVIVTGAFYFHTFNVLLKELAKKYHVIGVLCRMGGEGTELNADGSVNWARQWGKEIYKVTQKLGIEKFHFMGKCHGVIPGWYILKEHPDALLSLSSLSQSMHMAEQDSNQWFELQKEEGPLFSLRTLRKKERLALKAAEAKLAGTTGTVGAQAADASIGYYGSHAEAIFDSPNEVKAFVDNIQTPVLMIFATDDVLYWDFKTANEMAIYQTPRARTVILQGERHLFETDIPIRLAREIDFFIQGTKLPDE